MTLMGRMLNQYIISWNPVSASKISSKSLFRNTVPLAISEKRIPFPLLNTPSFYLKRKRHSLFENANLFSYPPKTTSFPLPLDPTP